MFTVIDLTRSMPPIPIEALSKPTFDPLIRRGRTHKTGLLQAHYALSHSPFFSATGTRTRRMRMERFSIR
jgi:hypothetical protein